MMVLRAQFFFSYEINGIYYPLLITNKHVVNYQSYCKMNFWLHLKNNDGEPFGNIQVNYETQWIFHSSKDMCFCFVNPLFEYVKKRLGKKFIIQPLMKVKLLL